MLKFPRSLFTPSTDRALKALTKTLAKLEAAAAYHDAKRTAAREAQAKLAHDYVEADRRAAAEAEAADYEAARSRKVISKLNTLIEA